MSDLIFKQQQVCNRYGFRYTASDWNLMVGISLQNQMQQPIHALRHPPAGNTTGWYIWQGEYNESDDFFQPVHTIHLLEYCPLIVPYLGLPAGCRVLIAEEGNYIDVWQDSTLLDI